MNILLLLIELLMVEVHCSMNKTEISETTLDLNVIEPVIPITSKTPEKSSELKT